ncbi:hypothetical protein AB0944_14725 [Streptomyces sp. NPDC048399]|uniref:hypothetical protein n=1 Tax=Streptomyces sp. NPDC048399 TaxID=3154821 RepID=UPI0034544EB8
MVSRSVTAFDIEARNTSDPAQFHGQGRIDMSSDGTKAAATHVLYEPGEDPWYPPDVVVIGNHAWAGTWPADRCVRAARDRGRMGRPRPPPRFRPVRRAWTRRVTSSSRRAVDPARRPRARTAHTLA